MLLLAIASVAAAQNAPQRQPQPSGSQGQQAGTGQQGQRPAQVVADDDPLDDVTPPIPITREIVRRVVGDANARVPDPQEIESVKRVTSAARRANMSPYPGNKIAKPVHRSIPFRPDTNSTPPKIRLWQGTVSALVFTDMSGNAWNIESVSINCELFDDDRSCNGAQGAQGAPIPMLTNAVSQANQGPPTGAAAPTNMLNIQSRQQYAYGNVIVRLQGLPSPVVFVLETGVSNENDMQIDVRVEGRNPGARPQLMTLQTLPGYDQRMGDFLDGVPPPGAQTMKVSGGLAEAWILNGAMYVRTALPILSPAFTDHVGSAEGMQVYKFGNSYVPNLLASVNGTPTTLVVSGN